MHTIIQIAAHIAHAPQYRAFEGFPVRVRGMRTEIQTRPSSYRECNRSCLPVFRSKLMKLTKFRFAFQAHRNVHLKAKMKNVVKKEIAE